MTEQSFGGNQSKAIHKGEVDIMMKTTTGVAFPTVINANGSINYDVETAKITNGMDTTHGSQFRTVHDHSSLTPLGLAKIPFKDTKSAFGNVENRAMSLREKAKKYSIVDPVNSPLLARSN